jgi:primosomal protein N' (replication factor Y)
MFWPGPAGDGPPTPGRPAPAVTRRPEASRWEGGDQARALVRVPRTEGLALAMALRAALAVRTARKDPAVVRLQLDPAELI